MQKCACRAAWGGCSPIAALHSCRAAWVGCSPITAMCPPPTLTSCTRLRHRPTPPPPPTTGQPRILRQPLPPAPARPAASAAATVPAATASYTGHEDSLSSTFFALPTQPGSSGTWSGPPHPRAHPNPSWAKVARRKPCPDMPARVLGGDGRFGTESED